VCAGDETVAKPSKPSVPDYLQALGQPQWITCDIRTFDMNVLGKFGVIMADPPWEIHQDLPYGTMADDEMRKMNIKVLQDDGVIFLWVTGAHVSVCVCVHACVCTVSEASSLQGLVIHSRLPIQDLIQAATQCCKYFTLGDAASDTFNKQICCMVLLSSGMTSLCTSSYGSQVMQ